MSPTPSPNSEHEHDSQDPAQHDARLMRRWYPVGFLVKLLILMASLIVLMLAIFFYAAGTEGGTRLILEKVAAETGVKLEYGQGNLRDGLLLTDIDLQANEDLQILVDKAYVKVGWRALFAKEVHLRDADIGRIEIIDNKLATDEPFAYDTIELPVNLRFDNASINRITYRQVGKQPIRFSNIHATDLTWVGTNIELAQGQLYYSDVLKVEQLRGSIQLQGDYPLDIKSTLTVNPLTQAYIDPLLVSAQGTLKRTVGRISSRYNDAAVQGEFLVQGLDDDAPFQAKLHWDDIQLPYLEEQNIHLHSGVATASGVISNIRLRINSDLSAKDIPSGHYRGRGVIANNQLHIEQLNAATPQGKLNLTGVLDWATAFKADIRVRGSDVALREFVPSDYIEYAPYLPNRLNGQLDLLYQDQPVGSEQDIVVKLVQRDGEQLDVHLRQGRQSAKSKQAAPWYIDARWQQLRRQQVPDIGSIDSPFGNAKVIVRGNRLNVSADARVQELNAAPKGDYQVKLQKVGDRIDLNQVNYKGVVGDLSATGQLTLATAQQPLKWQVNASSKQLLPQAYDGSLPVQRLSGFINASGSMRNVTRSHARSRSRISGQQHDIRIVDSDLVAVIDSDIAYRSSSTSTHSGQTVAITGSGDAKLDVINGQLSHFDARFNGNLGAEQLPAGQIKLDVYGTPKYITARQLLYDGEAGLLNARGSLDLRQNMVWLLDADMQNLDVGYFVPDTPAIVSGKLVTEGSWLTSSSGSSGRLGKFAVNFNGSLDTEQLPAGRLSLDASGDAQNIRINTLTHEGEAGQIVASGTVGVADGIRWDINAQMQQFNLGYFVQDMPSRISGSILTHGHWGNHTQSIAIEQMNLSGSIKQQPLHARGKLIAQLRLPKDLPNYLKRMQTQSAEQQYQQVNALVDTLKADNLMLHWGDNLITANGNEQQLIAQVNLTSLHQLSDNLAGKLVGGVTLLQAPPSASRQPLPSIYVDLKAANIALPNLLLTQGHIQGKIVNLAYSPSQLSIRATGLQSGDKVIDAFSADFEGTELNHRLHIDVTKQKIRLAVQLAGGYDRQQQIWRGILSNGKIESPYANLKQLQAAELMANVGSSRLQMAAHCWQTSDNRGKLCLQDKLIASAQAGQVDMVVQNIDTSLFAAFLPDDMSWQALLNGKAKASWQQGKPPTINATLYSDNGKIGMLQDGDSQPVTMSYQRVSLIAVSVANGLKLRTDITASRGGHGYADVVIDPYKDSKPIAGALVLEDFNLAVFKPFFPGMRVLEGEANLAGGLGGTLTEPLFYGNFDLSDGRVAMLGLPVNLNDINATAQIRGKTANIEGTFNSGDGVGELTGTVDWQQELQAKLSIIGERLAIVQPPMLSAEINTDIDVIVQPMRKSVTIEGAVTVPKATIRPPEATEEIVTESDDVVVLDRRMVGNIDEVLAISKPWSINTDIGLDLGDEVVFRGFGAVLPLAGAINVTQQGQSDLRARGVIQVSRRTQVDAFGQQLELNYGQLRFNGSITNPRLSIEAVKEIEGKTVGVRIKGNANEPNIVVFNNAGLTEQQAMNALVTGRLSNTGATQISEEGFKSRVTNTFAAAGLSFGFSGTRDLTNQIGRAFGFQSLTLDASGSQDDTNVNVTGYISPDLYIRYGIGVFTAESELSLRYQLTRRLYIEATSAAENFVDVVYSWKF